MTKNKASSGKAKKRRIFDTVSSKGMRQIADHLELSERDGRQLQELIENPPLANTKLRAVAADLP